MKDFFIEKVMKHIENSFTPLLLFLLKIFLPYFLVFLELALTRRVQITQHSLEGFRLHSTSLFIRS